MALTPMENGFLPRFLVTWLITAVSLLATAYIPHSAGYFEYFLFFIIQS
ncbi:MAG: hypothetical protein ACKO4S_17525 [Snowella sp.]